MRKAFVLFAVAFLVVGVVACKKGDKAADTATPVVTGKYADAIPFVEKFVAANETFVADLEKVATADDVVAAMTKITATLKDLAPKMKAIGEKYPEFKTQDNPPEEFKPVMGRLEAVMGKMMAAMGKAAPFMQDPKVLEAQKAYQEVMDSMK
jgi:uncharacterized protein YoxC